MPVEVVIIIPAFKQPRLLIEAAFDALNQETNFGFVVAIADDGCPLPETDEISQGFAAADRRVIVTSRIRNGGLSANRNSAVEAALSAYPDLKAITFLDADDRLDPGTLQHFYNELFPETSTASESRIGWVYTDPYQFGGIYGYLRKPKQYSALWHLWANSNSATSLIHVDVFKSGCIFDEAMQKGSEDWDFWLQAIRKGFLGKFVSPPTFRYRRRPESMTSNAIFYGSNITQYVREKNRDLYTNENISRLALKDASRYCVIWSGEEPACHTGYFLDALNRSDTFARTISQAAEDSYNPITFYPTTIVVAIKTIFQDEGIAPFIKDLLIRASESLSDGACCVILSTMKHKGPEAPRGPLVHRSDFDFDALDPVLERGDFAILLPTEKLTRSEVPRYLPGVRHTIMCNAAAPAAEERLASTLKSTLKAIEMERRGSRNYFGYIDHWQPENVTASSLVPRLLGVNLAPPFQITTGKRTALILDRHTLCGQERADLCIFLSELSKITEITIIIPSEDLEAGIAEILLPYAREIVSINHSATDYNAEHYLGARIVQASGALDVGVEDGRLIGYSTLIYAGFPALLSSAFSRRRQNVSIFGWWSRRQISHDKGAHNSHLSPGQRISDFSDHLLAYEHAIDFVVAATHRDAKYLNMRGIPAQKIIDCASALRIIISPETTTRTKQFA